MKLSHSILIALLLSAAAMNAHAVNIVECLAQYSKAECSRQMMIEEELSKPLTSGDKIAGVSEKYTITVQGENWLRNGWGGKPEKEKDLGLVKDSGVGVLNIERSEVTEADFETTITEDIKGIFQGLKEGFKKGKIDISATSSVELLPLSITGGKGVLGRHCYHMDVKDGKSVCVYEGFVTRTDGGTSYKLLGSIGDYNGMREELEGIITSFTFQE
jgi:hypothetical protein